MSLNRIMAVAAISLGMCSLAYAAEPVVPKIDLPFLRNLAPIPVHNSCHQALQNHGGAYPLHYHRQSNCAVVLMDEDEDEDCHNTVLRHYLPEFGARVWHRHRGPNCRVEVYEEETGPRPGVGGCFQLGPVTVCPP